VPFAPSGGAASEQAARAGVDTNVLIAAAIKPTGTCRELLDAAVELQWQPVLSPQLLSELETVMRRAKFKSKLTEEAIQDLIAGLVGISEVMADPPSTATHTPDPDDDYLVALALAARVDVLVSGGPTPDRPCRRRRPCADASGLLGSRPRGVGSSRPGSSPVRRRSYSHKRSW
jgi:putative PIN family toxin of toxin-antitoxin system